MSLVTNKFMALFCAVGASAYLAGCQDAGTAPDARQQTEFDANTVPTIDAGIDASGPDATPIVSGSISVQEVTIAGHPEFGQGVQVSISFEDDINYKPPVHTTGSLTNGCSVWEYTKAEADAEITRDEGSVQITSSAAGPIFPPCVFVAAAGSYLCISAQGANAATTVVNDTDLPPGTIPANTALVTITGAAFTAADVGRYLNIAGGAATNTGAFPVVGVGAAPGSVVIANPFATSTAAPFNATYQVLAGKGPTPGVADPGFIADGDNLTIALTPKAGSPFDPFSVDFGVASGVGDDFDLDAASQTAMTAIPTDGSAFTLACAAGSCGAGSGAGAIISISTTDGAVAGQSPVAMPAIVTKKVVIRCTKLGGTSVTVPADVSAYLMTSGATRIQTAFFRDALAQPGTAAASANVVAGHGVVGFTNP